jgi:poly(A) polymerase
MLLSVGNYNNKMSVISTDPPSVVERSHNLTLNAWVDASIEPIEETERRRRAVESIAAICKQWIRYTMITDFNLPASEDYGGRIFTTGSYRHGVHSSGSDIDMVLIAPNRITRLHFFQTLTTRLREQRGVTDLGYTEEAIVPIISFKFEGVDIDLSFVAIQREHVPDNINMLDDKIHVGLDENAVRSVNGVRDAILLIEKVPNTAVFRQALRFIKHWAKKRDIYGAKLGHTSGIGWAIMVAKVCQCYPQQNGAGVILRFFKFYEKWFTPVPSANRPNNPIFITSSLTPTITLPNVPRSWQPNPRAPPALYPIITPAYPYQNSCYTVNRTTLKTICDEFTRGLKILQEHMDAEVHDAPVLEKAARFAQQQQQQNQQADATPVKAPLPADLERSLPAYAGKYPYGVWSRVLESFDLFGSFSYFLHVAVSAKSFLEFDSWVDFVEAKIRLLWTETRNNPGAAFECYPQVHIRVVTRRFEEPNQAEVLAKLKAAAKAAAARRAAVGGAAASPLQTSRAMNPAASPEGRGSTGASSELAASPLLGSAATLSVPTVFTCHFYFGLAMDSTMKDAQGRPLPPPNLAEIVRAFHNVVRVKMTENTVLPEVNIVRSANLPSWLPGLPKPTDAAAEPAGNSVPSNGNGAAASVVPKRALGNTDVAVQSARSQPTAEKAAGQVPPPPPPSAAPAAVPPPAAAPAAAAADADELLGLDF